MNTSLLFTILFILSVLNIAFASQKCADYLSFTPQTKHANTKVEVNGVSSEVIKGEGIFRSGLFVKEGKIRLTFEDSPLKVTFQTRRLASNQNEALNVKINNRHTWQQKHKTEAVGDFKVTSKSLEFASSVVIESIEKPITTLDLEGNFAVMQVCVEVAEIEIQKRDHDVGAAELLLAKGKGYARGCSKGRAYNFAEYQAVLECEAQCRLFDVNECADDDEVLASVENSSCLAKVEELCSDFCDNEVEWDAQVSCTCNCGQTTNICNGAVGFGTGRL